jgi:succinate dehydrogenase hydrophobic anchor subunit
VSDVRKSARRGLLSAFAGAAAFGAWAALANWSHGAHARLVAGATQAALSFCTTFTLAVIAEVICARARDPRAQIALSTVGTSALLATALASVHAAVGTPEILRTIAPSVISGTLFCTSYVLVLRRSLAAREAATS